MEVANNVNPSNGGFAGEKKEDYLKNLKTNKIAQTVLTYSRP